MDHPGIARIFNAGETPGGRPYFAMELVRGIPITRYCDESRLPLRARQSLFVEACRAVQHAHQKGVIHRDLKPSNVLVAMRDGRPVPKVIDFGVAKAAGPQLTEETFRTRFAQMIGTPQYMSPEQAELSPLDVDTRSDVYALGVLLYELLTGAPPFTRERLRDASFDELRRIIREEEPETPSTRLHAGNGDAAAIAADRRTDPRRLVQAVRGDLDWIAMKALEKDRTRRYETANGLARDVERHLADEPVEARRPSAWYRARKFLRRHRAGATVAAAVLLAVVLAGGAVGWVARDRAARQAALEERITGALAQIESSYEAGRFADARAAVERAEGLVAAGAQNEALERKVHRWRRDLEMLSRLEQARLETAGVIGGRPDATRGVTGYREAFRWYGVDVEDLSVEDAAERIERSAICEELVAVLQDWRMVGSVEEERGAKLRAILGRADSSPWREKLRVAFGDGTELETLKELSRSPDVLALPPAALVSLARVLGANGGLAEAVELLSEAQRRHPDDFWVNHALAHHLMRLEPPRSAEAVRFYQAALALRPRNPIVLVNMGWALTEAGYLEQAETVCRDAIKEDPDIAWAHSNLGGVLVDLGDPEGGIAACRRAVALEPDVAAHHDNLGYAYKANGDVDEALACWRAAIALDPEFTSAYTNLGNTLADEERLDEAIELLSKARELDPETAGAHNDLGVALEAAGRFEAAVAVGRKAIALDPDEAAFYDNLGVALVGAGRPDDAIAAHRKAIALAPDYASAHLNLAAALFLRQEYDEALTHCRRAIDLDPENAPSYSNLGQILKARDDLGGAVAAYRRAIALDPEFTDAYTNLGNALALQGEHDQAEDAYRKGIELDPNDPLNHYNLGNLLRERGDFDAAAEAYRKVTELAPGFAPGHNNLGVAEFRRGRIHAAIEAFRRTLELDPGRTEQRFTLGNLYLGKGELERAIAAYRRVIEDEPAFVGAHLNLGVALTRRGDVDDAIAAWRRTLELEPDQALAHLNLGRAYNSRGDRENAATHFSRAVELGRSEPWALNDLAWILTSAPEPGLRDPERAVELAKRAVQLAPGDGTYHNTLGIARYRNGDHEAAIRTLEESMRLQGGGNSWDWYFLAMAHARLGHDAQAREWYDRAVAWHVEHAPDDGELRRFRAEAEHVLGLDGE
jgi:tetratricopeptide (TPR) repeat protein